MSNVLTKEYFEKHLDQKLKAEFAKRDKVLDKRFDAIDRRFELVDKRFEEQRQDFKNCIESSLRSTREEFQRYVGAVREDFQHSMQILAENMTGLHQKFDKLDGRVENLEVDMKYIKATLAVAEII